MKNQISEYKNLVTPLEIASKPHELASLLAPFKNDDPIAKAICRDTPIRSYEMDVFKEAIVSLVTQLVADAGQRISEEELLYLVKRLIEVLIKKYKGLTLREIRLAFECGIKGDCGDFYGVNLRTCLQFIEGYSKQRKVKINKMLQQVDIERIKQDEIKFLKYKQRKSSTN
ncbi:hypothetical protein EO244_14065 [Ancylomarina salipaludis]|uniref:Uncharacterized protein n=1 Tax=Ancylomarina salipaludis TaxID=2501299 RepID=A0A4Q1JIM9_9BACT|nr:hypothetical protein [Ancylomarina salipaludis]RXQ89488.1 hypothetical protein EO244_14065 [Ancylomarina salipaludis]